MGQMEPWVYFEYKHHEYRASRWVGSPKGIRVQRLGWVDQASATDADIVIHSWPKDQDGIDFQNLIIVAEDAIKSAGEQVDD